VDMNALGLGSSGEEEEDGLGGGGYYEGSMVMPSWEEDGDAEERKVRFGGEESLVEEMDSQREEEGEGSADLSAQVDEGNGGEGDKGRGDGGENGPMGMEGIDSD
jgi:hypothetical protein